MAKRSYAAGAFAMTIDGTGGGVLGFVKKFSGGDAVAELAKHDMGPQNIQRKQIANLKYEPITLEVGLGMSQGIYKWIDSALNKEWVSHNGSCHYLNQMYQSQARRDFFNSHITEVTVPTLDGSSKENAYMTVKIDPEWTEDHAGDGQAYKGDEGSAQKQWFCSNFRFELDGMPCERVSKVESFTWKQNVKEDEIGDGRRYTKHPTKVEVPNIKLDISMADIDAWKDWHREFVIEGMCEENHHKTAQIHFLNPSRSKELATITLDRVGILKLTKASLEANKEAIARFTVELYVEDMRFQYHSGSTNA